MSKARLLIAEDDADLRELLQDDLEDAGYETVGAVDGRAALAHIEREREVIDLLITDVDMPGLTGAELFYSTQTTAGRDQGWARIRYLAGVNKQIKRRQAGNGQRLSPRRLLLMNSQMSYPSRRDSRQS
jgi:CheY-like chemotaxis protein